MAFSSQSDRKLSVVAQVRHGERYLYANQTGRSQRVGSWSIGQLPAEKSRVRDKGYHVSFLMQWESGRTRRTLLQSVRESKAKRQTTSGVLSSISEYSFTHQTCPKLLLPNPPLKLHAHTDPS